jgi:multiple sugar transport system permease protein
VAGVVIPMMAPIFGIFMVRQFALGIPRELMDAARVDGASEWRIYWRIVVPLLRPILATLAIFIFLSSWNDFLWPLIVLSDDARYTLPVALANLSGEHAQDTELMMAGAVLTVMPVLLVFLFLQRHYVRGLLMGGVKG